ncbi:MAG: hypothetical protein QOI55_2608 [Actinomycetota bacterium]|jgi:hypothetical protein|nr:hypothetical protein [Actinomycetota bacterium]
MRCGPRSRVGLVRIGAVAVLAVVVAAAPAAAGGSLDELIGPAKRAFAGPLVADGTCPISYDTGSPHREPRQHISVRIAHRKKIESVRLSLCWAVDGALGGNALDFGTFVIRVRGGKVGGSVTGSVGFTSVANYHLELHIEHATGRLHRIQGDLTLFGCAPNFGDGSPLYDALLAVTGTIGTHYHQTSCTDTPVTS